MKNYFYQSSKVISSLKKEEKKINKIVNKIIYTHKYKGKILVAGHGGSCSDAEHFVGELTCTYKNRNRKPLSAISLASLPAAITAWSNDFGFDTFFERMSKAHLKKNDLLFLISTGGGDRAKGTSMSIVKAAEYARKKKICIISLLGKTGGELKKISDLSIVVKSNLTSHVQEAHIAILHYICESLDKKLS
jgi:D-sedoheptulose 7-phosphate isomerase|tara:strand:- start:1448 stop:2020 length:573 start_codon:yes stop_codon:yes gene_type:complete